MVDMSDWLDYDEDLLNADYPVCAAQLMDWIYDNIEVVQKRSGFDIVTTPTETSSIEYTFSTTDTWRIISTFGPIYMPLRRNFAGDYRDLNIGFSAKVSSAATLTLRTHVRGWVRFNNEPDASDGFIGENAYYQTTVATTSYSYVSGAVTPDTEAITNPPGNSGYGGTRQLYPTAVIMMIGKCTVATKISIKDLRIYESPV